MDSSPNDTTRLIGAQSSANELEIPLPNWEVYKIESLLGEGGMARVYKAFDPKLKRYVALKFIRSDDENLKKRLLREARAQAQIDHDHVCKIYEVGEVEGKSYIAMQLIQGETLHELAKDMSLEQKVLLMQQISDAVQAAHRIGIIHRDIKPSNIMIERKEDGSFRPYIMDFGIAREISDPGLTATDVVMGTPAFMAPEQILGDPQKVDRRTDIYCLGATLYYVFAGQPPFLGSGMDIFVQLASEDPLPLKQAVPTIPEDLDIIVAKCLEKEPSQRYESARALSEDLKRYLEGEPILAHRPTLKYRVIKKIRKNKTIAIVLGLAALIIIASAGFSIFSYWRASNQVEIARQFSQSVEAMDWIMRVAHMTPLHDIRKERSQVLKRMHEIESMMKTAGSAGIGPGNFALGRGFLTLQDFEKARIHLEKAWNAGYQGKEVASALGLTLGALFKIKLSEVDRITDAETQKIRLQAVEQEYRDPAVRYLRTGSEFGSQSREYGEALLSYYEKNWDNALRLARISSEKFPWLYEAKILEGDVFSRLGEQAFEQGQFEAAKKQFQAAADAYAKAEETSRSDPTLYESQCSLFRSVMEAKFAVGEDARKAYDASNAYCRQAILANPESATAFEYLAQTAWRWAENQFEAAEDPSIALNQAIEMSRKAQTLNPSSGYAYYTMGTAFGYLADYQLRIGKDPTDSLKQSITALKISVQKDPGFASTYTNLGVSYFSQGTQAMERGEAPKQYFLDAIEAYKKALQINPRNLAARANIANALSNLGIDSANTGADPSDYFQQSVENYAKALEINPNHWMIRSNLCSVYLGQIRDELDHGLDPTPTFQKILAEAQKAEKLKPGNPYSAINGADAYVIYGEYILRKNQSPLPWTKKAEENVASVVGADIPEVYLALGDGQKLEAQYWLHEKKSPVSALKKAKEHLDKAFKVNPAEHLIPLGQARLELIRAEWLLLNQQSPEDALVIAEAQLRKTLDLNAKSAFAYSMLGEVQLKRAEWKNRQKDHSETDIQDGLSFIEKSLKLKPDLAEAYAVKANLLLLDAQTKSDPAARARIATGSVSSFTRAFAINPMLRSSETENYGKAKSLARL